MDFSPTAALAVILIGAWIVSALAQPDMPSD